MSWAKLLAEKRLKRHTATPTEIADLRAVVDRDLQDACLSGLSPDRSFAIAYNAALQVAKWLYSVLDTELQLFLGIMRPCFKRLNLLWVYLHVN